MSDSANDAYTQATDWVVDTAKRNPEALLVLGAGLALLLRSRGKSSSIQAPRYAGPTGAERPSGWQDGLSRAANGVGDYAADASNRVAAAAGAANDYAGSVAQTISSGTSRLADQAQTVVQSGTNRILDTQPLAVAVFGAAAGAALAALIPSTEAESRTLGATREAIVEAASKAGESLMDAAGEAGGRLKQGAAERGISSEGIKELAHDVADTFTSKISGTSNSESH